MAVHGEIALPCRAGPGGGAASDAATVAIRDEAVARGHEDASHQSDCESGGREGERVAADQSARALPMQPPEQKRPGRADVPRPLGSTQSGEALMTRPAVSVRLIAGAPVALVDHARAERPGLDQVQRDVFGDRRQERLAASDDDQIANKRSSSTRPSSNAAAARPAPPIETSVSVASGAAATSSATDAWASRALPWTLSSARLKTTFGIAHQTRCRASTDPSPTPASSRRACGRTDSRRARGSARCGNETAPR
jgi:hypothetical protein